MFRLEIPSIDINLVQYEPNNDEESAGNMTSPSILTLLMSFQLYSHGLWPFVSIPVPDPIVRRPLASIVQ